MGLCASVTYQTMWRHITSLLCVFQTGRNVPQLPLGKRRARRSAQIMPPFCRQLLGDRNGRQEVVFPSSFHWISCIVDAPCIALKTKAISTYMQRYYPRLSRGLFHNYIPVPESSNPKIRG